MLELSIQIRTKIQEFINTHAWKQLSLVILLLFSGLTVSAQNFYFGADLSYVNEMTDCGADYKEDNNSKGAYEIFADHNTNLVRLRLWHTPAWYDNLNAGNRYSDLNDVKRSIRQAKDNGMQVLLDFHLSDSWADPSKQLVPAAWLGVVDNLPLLQDSLYNYITETLTELYDEDLLPEMVQMGNETNRGILLSPEDNQQWTLEWDRNVALFNTGLLAVRDFERETNSTIKIVIHLAAPAEVTWLVDDFISHGITDFDIIGISYYWSWHKPTSIANTGEVIRNLKSKYPSKEVMIVETGYIWTYENSDSANDIINNTNPGYDPPSPINQARWLIDLAQEVIISGGNGVIYWEPVWVSTDCRTLWAQGSHQENATFFDFDNNLQNDGGITWMEHDYLGLTDVQAINPDVWNVQVSQDSISWVRTDDIEDDTFQVMILDITGQVILNKESSAGNTIDISSFISGSYVFAIFKEKSRLLYTTSFVKY